MFPALESAGDITLYIARAEPERTAPAVKILRHLVLRMAQRRLWIQNPYCLPYDKAVMALAECGAPRRGRAGNVPSASASYMSIVQHAAHHNCLRLLAAGVRVSSTRPRCCTRRS
ncbi:hypothetical protein [Azohydromonas australica]|uniref:hypothetical protein n=1 Tax=Azohydromonas australica TaxID=364039 RepID=UPI0012EB13E8|nr:hypothetical protein [Azohydromonas australica]